MNHICRVELLGWFRTSIGDVAVDKFQTQKTESLLAFLALNKRRYFSRNHLVEVIWPGVDVEQARNRLNQALSWLRRNIDNNLVISDRMQVKVNADLVNTDVEEFERAIRKASQTMDLKVKIDLFESAVKLYRGELLPGMQDEWILDLRLQFSQSFARMLKQLIDALELAGDREAAIRYARQAVSKDPLDEENHFALIRLLGLEGNASAALRQYKEAEHILGSQLNVSLSSATLALIEQIQQDRLPVGNVESPAASTPQPAKRQDAPRIPRPLTHFYGREEEITRIQQAIETSARLITLIGPGGSGKTRLAIESALRLGPDLYDAQWLVSLVEVSDPLAISGAIIKTLGVKAPASRPLVEAISEELNQWQSSLLILDNFDQVIAGAGVLHELLDQVQGLTVLATSRQRLNIEGEHEIHVSALPVPGQNDSPEKAFEYPSVQMFVDRARAARVDFDPSADLASIQALVYRLEGIPLAIELAAAWVQTYTPGQMLQEVDRRFDLLVSRREDISPRHRTLRATVEYSYRLLSPELQVFFTKLAVFNGSWSLKAAAAISGEPSTREWLADLQERSLVIAEEVGRTMRYRMLDTLREYASEQLSEEERVQLRNAHADYFAGQALRLLGSNLSDGSDGSYPQVASDFPNFASTLEWCLLQGRVAQGLGLASALVPFWEVWGPISEGRSWLSRLLELPAMDLSPAVRAEALYALGRLAWHQSDFKASAAAHEESLEIQQRLGNRAAIAQALYALGIISLRLEDHARAEELLQESTRLAEELNDKAGIARGLLNLGNLALDQLRNAEAKKYYERSLVLERELGNVARAAGVLNNLGNLAYVQNQHTLAKFYLEESLRINRMRGVRGISGVAVANLARIAMRRGDLARSIHLYNWSTRVFLEFGYRFYLYLAVNDLSLLASILERYEDAAFFREVCLILRQDLGILDEGVNPPPPFDEASEIILSHVGEEDLIATAAFAKAMPLERLIEISLEIIESMDGGRQASGPIPI